MVMESAVPKCSRAETSGARCLPSCLMMRFSNSLLSNKISNTYRTALPGILKAYFCNALFREIGKKPVLSHIVCGRCSFRPASGVVDTLADDRKAARGCVLAPLRVLCTLVSKCRGLSMIGTENRDRI